MKYTREFIVPGLIWQAIYTWKVLSVEGDTVTIHALENDLKTLDADEDYQESVETCLELLNNGSREVLLIPNTSNYELY